MNIRFIMTWPVIEHTIATCIFSCLTVLFPAASYADEEIPLSGPAYEIAVQGYEAFDQKNYELAIIKAREAIRQRPDIGRLRGLLIQSYLALGQSETALEEARRAASDGQLSTNDRNELDALSRTIERQITLRDDSSRAYELAQEAYGDYARAEYESAVAKAREAASLDPSRESYGKLLSDAIQARDIAGRHGNAAPSSSTGTVDTPDSRRGDAPSTTVLGSSRHPDRLQSQLAVIDDLTQRGRTHEALTYTETAIRVSGRHADLLVRKGILETKLGNSAAAYNDLQEAIRLLPSAKVTRFLRLSFADAAIETSHPREALSVLSPLGEDEDGDVWLRRARSYTLLKDYAAADRAFRMAGLVESDTLDRAMVLSERIRLTKSEGRDRDARDFFDRAYLKGDLAALSKVDLAYLAGAVGNDEVAFEAFKAASQDRTLHGTQVIDAAYAARRSLHTEEAVNFFKQAIDAANRGRIPLSPRALYGLRREVSDLTRTWGSSLSLNYGSSGVANTSTFPSTASGRTTQLGSELYWRPPVLGIRDGAIVELFVRDYVTLSDSFHGPVGLSTLQGNVGARWKPFRDYNFVLEVSRLFKIGEHSRYDTLLRAALSGGIRNERTKTWFSPWLNGQYYMEVGKYLQTNEMIADGEVRFGPSLGVEPVRSRITVSPFLGLEAAYDSNYETAFAFGAGPGIQMRYWFDEDKYHAPRSYIDVVLQYRFHIAGDNRAQGLFAGINVSF